MSFGNMNREITIVQTVQNMDAAGFSAPTDTPLATVRAYKEERHGAKMWANRATFSTATALFRFRVIPGLTVTDKLVILCGFERFNIVSAEDVRGRGMYIEALAEKVTASKNG